MTLPVFTANEVPTQPRAFSELVTLNGVQYTLTVRWCAPANCWLADLADAGGAPILSGFPFVTGTDLLGQFVYLGIGGAFIVQSDNNPDEVPNYTSLGVTGHLYYLTAAA